ncbi:MAG TPA: ABC transporter ATP-binding protein [Candidatus Limnocylindrales bacterium]|nr:ABC transporter ATP-binding protein [Candidatus Limnocylindrales bacterium]
MTAPGASGLVVEARRISVGYDRTLVVDGLDLTVAAGEMVVLLGPSGSGKTTILSAIAGFLPIRSGALWIDGQVVAAAGRHVPPERRNVAVVFQGSALWPHLSALDTVAYPIRRRGAAMADARREARAILARLGIAHLADRRPAEMSGGEQQRVGLGRAVARGAALHLFDEPTAHLDGPLRERLLDEIAATRRATGAAGIYATHDTAEALAIADRVALIRDGRLVQVGPPIEVYEAPVDGWAARLTGPASELDAVVVGPIGDLTEIDVAGVRVRAVIDGPEAGVVPSPARLLVRPDWATLGGPLPGVVAGVRFRGSHTDIELATPAGDLTIRRAGPPSVSAGDEPGWTLVHGRRLRDEPTA